MCVALNSLEEGWHRNVAIMKTIILYSVVIKHISRDWKKMMKQEMLSAILSTDGQPILCGTPPTG